MTFMNQYNDLIQEASEVLRNGGTILYPTDTIWGIGCDATNALAVDKIYKIKQREESKSLITLLDDDRKLNRYVRDVPETAWDILEYATRPTTIIYDRAYNVAENAIAKDGSLGIRICSKGICNELLRAFGKPIISTSANLSGKPSPNSFQEISNDIKSQVDFILDIPEFYSSKSKASTLIQIKENMEVKILRK